jgi:tRNA pseudouridine55 synthase
MMMKSEKLDINGILLLNKPAGLTSNAVLQIVKRLYQAKKAGHTGSLDPMATGMLPICFGEATKFSQYLLDADKCYETTGLLGIKTNTGDAMGEIIARSEHFNISKATLESVLTQFVGPIDQVPSMFSALKHQGKPLYHYARAGIDITRSARQIVIHDLILQDFDGLQFSLKVRCSKGTYIRNLVEDIGECLGAGAHVTRLHRCYTMGFEHDPMVSVETLQEMSVNDRLSLLQPMERAVFDFPPILIQSVDAEHLRQGKVVDMSRFLDKFDIEHDFALRPSACVRLYDDNHQFMGLGEIDEAGLLKVKRLIAYKTMDS